MSGIRKLNFVGFESSRDGFGFGDFNNEFVIPEGLEKITSVAGEAELGEHQQDIRDADDVVAVQVGGAVA